jgi:hypothetical protein
MLSYFLNNGGLRYFGNDNKSGAPLDVEEHRLLLRQPLVLCSEYIYVHGLAVNKDTSVLFNCLVLRFGLNPTAIDLSGLEASYVNDFAVLEKSHTGNDASNLILEKAKLEVGLWFATKVNYLEGVKYFLREGASQTRSTLYVSARFNSCEIIEFMIESGRDYVDEVTLHNLYNYSSRDDRIDVFYQLTASLILQSFRRYPDKVVRQRLQLELRRLTPR